MFRVSLCPSSGEQDVCYCMWCAVLIWFRLYIRKSYISRNLLLFYASIHLFIYRYEYFFNYIYVLNICIAEILHTTRLCICLTRRTGQNVQRIAAALFFYVYIVLFFYIYIGFPLLFPLHYISPPHLLHLCTPLPFSVFTFTSSQSSCISKSYSTFILPM